jgi:predicted transposase/invertase (TIGR01784 family)
MATRKNEKKGKTAGKVYAELLCDFMFKRLFGSEANKDVLIGFLNIVLEDVEIVEVEFIPTEHRGLSEDDRIVIFDIACKCKNGSSFIIEMQKGYQTYFKERALYYTTYPINEQGRYAHDMYIKRKAEGNINTKFNWDYNLQPVTVVAILNFRFTHKQGWPTDEFRSSYRLHEDTYGEVMTEALRFVFLELGRFNKYIWELETVTEKWMYLLKHMHEMVVIPNEFDDPVFSNLFLLAKINNFTSDELKQYQKSLENMGEFENIVNSTAEIAEMRGREQGRAEEALKVAKEMLADGMPVDKIVKYTGISEEEIKTLQA